ncbi:GTPase ObgE [Candidatus Woesebacteria bacterium]|nr:MAG: GTPase ObgE [Candidatus Woesebacteria bacterium]
MIDETHIILKAGDGGEGAVSFGKHAKSGPDGGNGGDGGNIYITTSSDLTLLSQFQGKRIITAEFGYHGSKDKKAGRKGNDIIVSLPVGSLIVDQDTNEEYELEKVGETFLFCNGGIGGIGNFDLRSSRNTTPKNTIPATKGQKRQVKIVLRYIADYGLIGLPNAGKSSLLNALTNAKVKTANYNFTTLSANLGVLPNGKVIADIPGLIEGASTGKGLGIKFLKHIQKVSVLFHCISTESTNPSKDYKTIRNELKEFDQNLLNKKEVILITKSDLVDKKDLVKVEKYFKKLHLPIYCLSIYDPSSVEKLYEVVNKT